MNNLGRNIFIWIIIGVAVMSLFNLFQGTSNTAGRNVAYSDLVATIESGDVEQAILEGPNITAITKSNQQVKSYVPEGADIVSVLTDNGVRIEARPDESNMPGILLCAVVLVPNAALYWCVDFLHASNAGRRPWWRYGVWEVSCQIIKRSAWPCHF